MPKKKIDKKIDGAVKDSTKLVSKKVSKKYIDKKVKVSHKFVNILAVVSILGFIGIVSKTLLDFNLNHYIEALWMLIVGWGLILEARLRKLRTIARTGLASDNFANLITIVIGGIAILAGIFSFPFVRIETPAFLAVKGIVSIIAIVIIAVHTWVLD